MLQVLIVEDEIMLAMDLEDILSDGGHEVVGVAHDLSEAVRIEREPVVALVDLNLRDGPTGRAVAEALARKSGTRVIFVTANPAQIGVPPSGAIGYVQKPFSPEAILGAVRYAATGGSAPLPCSLHLFDSST